MQSSCWATDAAGKRVEHDSLWYTLASIDTTSTQGGHVETGSLRVTRVSSTGALALVLLTIQSINLQGSSYDERPRKIP